MVYKSVFKQILCTDAGEYSYVYQLKLLQNKYYLWL